MAPRWCIYVAHRWRLPKLMIGLFVLELPLTIAALVLFGVADPNTYRTKLWQNGSDRGFNSDPNEILYSYANYEPIKVPLVWSQFMTQFNVVVSVLSMFILLVKSTMFVLASFVPLLSVFVHALLVALYAVAVRNQATPDLSDTSVPHLSKNLPWYLSKGCGFATEKNYHYCMQARASFAVTCVMLALFVLYFALAIWSSIITQDEKSERQSDYDTEIELKNARYTLDPDAGLTKEEKWERNRQIFMNLPKTPNTPGFGAAGPMGVGAGGVPAMTPRTTAFTQLSGENAGNYHAYGGSAGGMTPAPMTATSVRPLAFREYYEGKGVPQYEDVEIPAPR